MTDKQIIIDGVDVSGYEFYNKDDKTCREVNGKYDIDICEFDKCENSNCYFKQLKRKEQELQEAMDNYVQLDLQRVKEYNELVELYKAKEQECEKLKEELQAQRDFTAHEQKLIYCVAYDETCKTGNDCKQEKCIFKENIKLKQALAEIKEICNSVENIENINSLYDAKLSGMYLQANKILQKISECEVENEHS